MSTLVGTWSGNGKETQMDSNGIITSVELNLTKKIEKISNTTYLATDTYKYMDGTLNYGPVSYIINTGTNSNVFTCADSLGCGIDYHKVIGHQFDETKFMSYSYNINGLPISESQPFVSLDGTYTLRK